MKKVTVIIPCYHEEKFIAQCLDSVIKSDWPKADMEIFVVDGMSEDNTRAIIQTYAQKHSHLHLLDNPKKTTPAAMNIGIKNAKGDIIVRLDAHTVYSPHYITKSVNFLLKSEAANVGGIIETLPSSNSLLAKSIALSLSHFFGVGLSYFRIGSRGARCVDTVPFGCFKKELFDEIGLFDETRARSEDIEINERIRKAGKKVILNPEIVSFYYARGKLKDFFWHNFDNGRCVTAPLGKDKKNAHSLRHFTPLLCISLALGLVALSLISRPALLILLSLLSSYVLLSLYFAFKTALREKNLRYFFTMPLIFSFLHMSYALGSLYGMAQHFLLKFKPSRKAL